MDKIAGTCRQSWTSVLCPLLASLLLMQPCIEAQDTPSLDPSTRRVMQEAAKQGFPLQTSLNVSGLTGIPEAASALPQKPAAGTKAKKQTPATPTPPAPAPSDTGASEPAGAVQNAPAAPQAATGAGQKPTS